MSSSYLQCIFYKRGHLELIDQLALPHQRELVRIKNIEDAWTAIREMRVRGAPAIAVVACLSVALEITCRSELDSVSALSQFLAHAFEYLRTSRPTAVNLRNLTEQCRLYFDKLQTVHGQDFENLKEAYIRYIEALYDDDVDRNRRIGQHGADQFLKPVDPSQSVIVLTHCNTGSLATCGYGTALGVVRRLNEYGRLSQVYFTETRPYFQGARLTAYEIVQDKIPGTMVCDNMVGMLMNRLTAKTPSIPNIYAVVGADRIAANGDTANKIGTLTIAICAKHYGVPFYVAAPISTVDLETPCGSEIVIEERNADEMTKVGSSRVAADEINVWNPAFDVTPNSLIAGIITEYGVFKPCELAARVRELREQEATLAASSLQ